MMTAGTALHLVAAFLPVSLFLGSLVYLDSYKLVRFRTIVQLIGAGAFAAGASYLLNKLVFAIPGANHGFMTVFVAPLIEETLKAIPLILLIRSKRAGFMVDTAIFGFAIGTGFALIENCYYFWALPQSSAGLWIARGFGTAIMHGGSTAIVGMISKLLTGKAASKNRLVVLGLFAAYAFHAMFNSFFLPPLLSAVAVIVLFPPLIVLVFAQSERHLRSWLGSGFDLDSDLLAAIQSGSFVESHAGEFLKSLRDHFDGPVLADMLCLLRLNAELALRAKGILMMRESGFEAKRDQEIDEKLAEADYLRKSIGRTGELALAPVLHSSAEDIWQLRLLEPA